MPDNHDQPESGDDADDRKATVEMENGELTESTLRHEQVDHDRRDPEGEEPIRQVRNVGPLVGDAEMQVPDPDN